jgi:hypothetical protein
VITYFLEAPQAPKSKGMFQGLPAQLDLLCACESLEVRRLNLVIAVSKEMQVKH